MTTELSDSAVHRPSVDVARTAGVLPRLLSQWWVAFAASAVFVVSGHLLIKAGLNSLAPVPASTEFVARVLHVVLHPMVVAGLLIYLMGTVCWMRAVSQKEISFLYPLSSVNFVLIAAASMVLLQEEISARRMAGVGFVVCGMILMNTRSREGRA
jgi:drug/metabolite transporter (DMT)-like permease